jgi:hypothetical protein
MVGGRNAALSASTWRSCIAKNWLYDVRYQPPGSAMHTRVESSINFYYNGGTVTDVINSNAFGSGAVDLHTRVAIAFGHASAQPDA